MAIYLATKTKEVIDAAIEADQGSKYREWLGKVIPTISDAFDPRTGKRSHLGVSGIGHPCARKLFFDFRWVLGAHFQGRTLRLFNRGHLEEGRFIAMLLSAGMQIYQQDSNGKQFRISELGGHFGSAVDGIVIGCPDMPDSSQPILTEMKTHNDKSFKKLVKEGVKVSKPIHYVQMQVYMRKLGLGVCLYIAVNKNDDELYCELVPFDSVTADMYIDRGNHIVLSQEPAVGLSDKGASWFECKFCDYQGVCYRRELPQKNCRTCRYSQALQDGTWTCNLLQQNLTTDEQLKDCSHYEMANYYG